LKVPDTLTEGNYIISKVASDPNPGYGILLTSGAKLQIWIVNTYYSKWIKITDIGDDLSDNTWHHIVWTYSGSGTAAGNKIYVDNVEKSGSTSADNLDSNSILNNADFTIGARSTGHYGAYPFTVDDVRLYEKVINSSDRAFLYNSGDGTSDSCKYSTVPYYVMTENSNQIDVSGMTVSGFRCNQTTPSNTACYYLLSVDGRSTWKYWNGTAWQTSTLGDIATNGNTKAELEALTAANAAALSASTTLDICVALKTTDGVSTPVFKSFTVLGK